MKKVDNRTGYARLIYGILRTVNNAGRVPQKGKAKMAQNTIRATATYADYEDADYGRIDEMKAAITSNGGTVTGEAGGEEDNEYRIGFRCATDEEFGRIAAAGEDAGWEIERR